MNGSLFSTDLFAALDRIQRELQQAFDWTPSIRGLAPRFPALNLGATPQSVEIYAFAPGLDPQSIEVQLEKGVLTIAGERKPESLPEQAVVHIGERYAGPFRRVVTLPDDIDADAVRAEYRDGVLHISVGRKLAQQPRRITVS